MTDKESKKPTHDVYLVRDGEGDKSFWNKIGAAWTHEDSEGFNVVLDGRIVIRTRKNKNDEVIGE